MIVISIDDLIATLKKKTSAEWQTLRNTRVLGLMFGLKPERATLKARICQAIRSRRVVQFQYGARRRGSFFVVEPYCYGLLTDGEETLLCYQVSGHGEMDVPVGWKLYRPSLISDLEVTSESFAPRRSGPGYDSRHYLFRTAYCQILPGKSEGGEPKEPAKPEPESQIEAPLHAGTTRSQAPVRGHNELMNRFRRITSTFHRKDNPKGTVAK